MQAFYNSFYAAVEHSSVHAEFCTRVFGRNLCQHGFADMAQLNALIAAVRIEPGSSVLDIGGGNGMIAEYISDRTGAHVTGLDFSPDAIERATARTAAKADRLAFVVGDINALKVSSAAYDVILSIDSIYFSDDYARTVCDFTAALRPGGRLGFLYSYGREPWVAKTDFPTENLAPERTPLGVALTACGLTFTVHDFTVQDHQLALRRKGILSELRPQFEAEGLQFIWENRMGDANGVAAAVEEGLHRRYLYVAKPRP
ncbi:MAG: methyltransferase domain-containing protein [Anaerolinea sp.]|nr:methyltransferase domain-containing protein [Anaerolinea sp.]